MDFETTVKIYLLITELGMPHYPFFNVTTKISLHFFICCMISEYENRGKSTEFLADD